MTKNGIINYDLVEFDRILSDKSKREIFNTFKDYRQQLDDELYSCGPDNFANYLAEETNVLEKVKKIEDKLEAKREAKNATAKESTGGREL